MATSLYRIKTRDLCPIAEDELTALANKLKLAAISDEHKSQACEALNGLAGLIASAAAPLEAANALASQQGVLAAMQSLLSAYSMDEAAVISALALLGVLAGSHTRSRESLVSSPCRLIDTLVTLLQHDSPAVAAAAARCMRLVTSGFERKVCERLLQKRRNNAAPAAAVLAHLVKTQQDDRAAVEAAQALQNLAAAVPADLVGQKGVLSALITGMESATIEVVLPSSRAVAALAADAVAAQMAAKSKGTRLVAALAGLLIHADQGAVVAAATALTGLAQHCPTQTKELVASTQVGKDGSTVMAVLAQMTGGGTSSGTAVAAAVSSAAAQALAALLDGCPANVKLLCKQKGPAGACVIDLLISCLRGSSEQVMNKGALVDPLPTMEAAV